MRRYFALLLILTCSVPASNAQEAESPTKPAADAQTCAVPESDRAIRKIAEDFKNFYNAGQAAKVAGLYTADAYYLTQHFVTGVIRGRNAIQAYIQRGVDAKYKIDSIAVLVDQLFRRFRVCHHTL